MTRPNLRRHLDAMLDRRIPPIPLLRISLEERLALVRLHGNFSLAYSTAVQPGLSYFGDNSGYIAFDTKMGIVLALGDPIAEDDRMADYLKRFIAVARSPVFVQIGERTAHLLSGLGFTVNQMGFDTHLILPTHDFSGKRLETVRYSERWLARNKYSIVEGTLDAAAGKHLSREWLARRIVRRREMAFLNRPFSNPTPPGMRRFLLLDPMEKPVALLDFDPIQKAGETIGYTTSFKRKLPGTTAHAETGMTKFAVDRFRREGARLVTLGLAPLAAIGPSGFRENRLLRVFWQKAFRSKLINRRIFNLQGQAAFKRRFHGSEVPTYVAARRLSFFRLIALLRSCKLI